MENIALIAIVVLIIILALVFMLMRRNQADADVFEDEPLLPSKTEHTDSAMANQPTPMDLAEQNVPSPQFGVVAKQLMAQQRFDDAEAELLRGIHSQPNNTQLKLDLLNLYAQTSNINKFNQTYAQVQQSGDTGIISEAKHLKSLIDAEIQTRHQSESKPEPSVQSVTSDDDTPLDFNAGNIDNALDFGNEQPVAQQPMAQTTVAQTSDDAFNDNAFSLEDLEADLLDTTSTLDLDTNDDAGLTGDDDLTFDLDDSKPTSDQITSPTTAENDGLDFDFGIESTEEDHATATQSDQPSLQTDTNDDLTVLTDTLDTSDDLSFDLSEDDVVSDNLVSDVESADLSFDIESDFDLNTEVDATESAVVRDANIQDANEVVVNDVSEISADALTTDQGNEDDSSLDDSLDFDLGSLDDDASKVASDSPTTHLDDTTELSNEFDLSDFGLDDDLITQDDSSQPSQPLNQQPQQPSQQDSDDRQAFDLGMDLDFDTADISPVQSDVKAQEPSISDLTPTDHDANVASDKSNLVDLSELDVSDLDNAQITMDLAGQYIELGEYDSARRLLNEITQSANEPYLNQAKELLAQIN
ncbi:FimV/HubP family polar landmark protein [Moraxella lincolnii]|uniref:Pilus assembly protein FimV n=1 Tax=Lwoffella lincolnii TaxID=90241 RepID=A0A1T0CHB5_9GAMM|nr:FimV/HubP family polar landmark protein [Moraxella lincolnii]OOS21740.1 hypothetical protein B0682_03685 [Moraxella lincolnii]